jgi:hemerythrin superfamily protein
MSASALAASTKELKKSHQSCDRNCLLEQAKQFNESILTQTTAKLPLDTNVQIRENTKAISLTDSKWMSVKRILSVGTFTDPTKGNVIEHVTAETTNGKPVYIGTRLKIVGKKITEVEINFDDSPKVKLKNLIPYDPLFNTLVSSEDSSTREQLEQIITRYFQGLTDHNPVEADYDPRCDRFHSGERVTHNARNGIEESGEVGCYESNLGQKPWGPASEVRIALIDPERGIVIAYSILHYSNTTKKMQINEIFKIINGRIRMIDNIGLMQDDIITSGFTN